MGSGLQEKILFFVNAFKSAIAIVCLLISFALSVALLGKMMQVSGGISGTQTAVNLDAADKFRMNVNNKISDAVDGVVSVKKVYWINGDSHQAPKPNPKCYGSTEDPSSLQWLIDEAAEVLEGQELLFSTEAEIMPGSAVQYYLDETILVIAWKEVKNDSVYTYAEAKIVHPSQFRRFLAGDAFGSGTLSLTTEMAESVNAVLAGNGDYYAYRPQGTTVMDGVVYRSNSGVPELCHVTRDGDLLMERNVGWRSISDTQKYVDEHNVNFTLAFGPILVHKGELKKPASDYPLGEVVGNFTRDAICQMDRLHYLFIATNVEEGHFHTPDIYEFSQIVYETGCKEAYTLDGGQTATVVMDNELVNCVNYGSQRMISDIIYFATAVPSGG